MEEYGQVSDMMVDSKGEDPSHPNCIAHILRTYLHSTPLVNATIYRMLGEMEYFRMRNSERSSEAGNQVPTPMDVDAGSDLNGGSSHNSSSSTLVEEYSLSPCLYFRC